MKNKIILTIASALISSVALADLQKIECRIDFPNDSVEYDSAALNSCLSNAKKDEIGFLNVFATATFPGTSKYNRILSERRAAKVKADLEKLLPLAQIDTAGGGESPIGRRARVFAYIASNDNMIAGPSLALNNNSPVVIQSTKTASRSALGNEITTRLAIRGGRDYYRESASNYNNLGAEFAALSPIYGGLYRGEVGVSLQSHSQDEVLDLYSMTGFAGAYVKANAAVAGVRGFVGNLARADGKQNSFIGGGELRAGLDFEKYSIFASAGRSRHFNQIGIDVGVKL